MTRRDDLEVLVGTYDIDIDRVDTLRAFYVIRDARSINDEIGLLGMAEALIGAIDVILGEGAVVALLGDRPKVTELLIVAGAVIDRLGPQIEKLIGLITDLTATVPED